MTVHPQTCVAESRGASRRIVHSLRPQGTVGRGLAHESDHKVNNDEQAFRRLVFATCTAHHRCYTRAFPLWAGTRPNAQHQNLDKLSGSLRLFYVPLFQERKPSFPVLTNRGNPRLPTNSSAARRTAPKESVSLVRLVARQKLDGFPRFAHRSPPNGLVPVGCCVCTLRNLRCWSSRRACPLPGIRRRAEPLWRLDNLRTCQTQLAPGLDGRSRYQEGSA
jgi:hypothetical protein